MYLDEHDSLSLAKQGYYERQETDLIKQLLKPEMIALDIGAHIGYFTLLMAKSCKRVYTFEPNDDNFKTLCENIKLNFMTNIYPFHFAIGEKRELVKLYLCDYNSGMHRSYPSNYCTNNHQLTAIENIDFFDFSKEIDFIKMDIEGSEFGALKGMERLLDAHHPTILMEFCPKYIREYGADPEEEYHFLKTLGYDVRLLPDKDTPISYEKLERETNKEPTGRNILCIKR
jgi:FkbM family methyltransferase